MCDCWPIGTSLGREVVQVRVNFPTTKTTKLTHCIKSYVGSAAQIFGLLTLSAYSPFQIEEFRLYASELKNNSI